MNGRADGRRIGYCAVCGAVTWAGCRRATICGRPEASPKRTNDSAALPRTVREGSSSIFEQGFMKAGAGGVLAHHPGVGIADFIHGYDANRTTSGYQRVTLASCRPMRSPICTRHAACGGAFCRPANTRPVVIGELPPEPGVPPEEKWHGDDEPCGDEEKNTLAGGHAAAGFG